MKKPLFSSVLQGAYKTVNNICKKLQVKNIEVTLTPDQMQPKKIIRNPYKKDTKLKEHLQRENETIEIGKKNPIYFASTWSTDSEWIKLNNSPRSNNAMRLWIQNPNGVSAKNGMRVFRSELEESIEKKIDFLALPESKLNSNNNYVFESISTIVESHSATARVISTNTYGYNQESCYQPGGVMSVALGKLKGRYAGMGKDPLGRYNWIKFCGKKKTLKIYTFYRVSQDSGTGLGDTTAFVQQYNLLNKIDKTDQQHDHDSPKKHKIKNPRQDILQCLMHDIKKDIAENTLVIIMGDLNENIFKAAFDQQLEAVGMVNALKDLDLEKCRSYNRGKKVIDGIWMSCILQQYVENVGLAPFYEIFNSDHRAVFLDIDLRSILDEPSMEFKQIKFRRLQSSIPKRTNIYSKLVQEQWDCHNMKDRIETMKNTVQYMTTNELKISLNKVDKQIGEILTHAEKKCTKISRHAIHQWSPKLGNAIKLERNVNKEISKLRRCDLTSNVKDIKAKLKEATTRLRNIKQDIHDIKKNHKLYRQEHLDDLIQEHLQQNPNSNYAGELKRLKHIEYQRSTSAQIKKSSTTKRKQGVSKILIPARNEYCTLDRNKHMNMNTIWERIQKFNGKDIGNWEEITDRHLVESLTLSCMQKHFGQANGSILTEPRWNRRLVDPEFVEAMRDKNFDELNEESEAVQEYFRAMSENVSTNRLKKFVYSLEDWSDHISRVKERTTTSPDGRHYGHFKVLLKKLPEVFEQIYTIMNLALGRGIVLERWKKTVTVLIPKDEGVPKIHRLRPLHIVEPEINAISEGVMG